LWSNGKDEYLVVHGCDYATAHKLSDGSQVWRLGDLNPKSNYNASLRLVASPALSPDLIVVPTAKGGPVVGLKPDAKGEIAAGDSAELWRMPKGTTDVPTPLIHEGLVYMCRENGTLICLDAKTGKEVYNERLHSAKYRGSPVLADGKVYLTAADGVISVVKLGPKFEKLAENRMGETVTASPAISGGKIYIRGWNTLYCVDGK
jgi:outer membrane protein assembly factor BamB